MERLYPCKDRDGRIIADYYVTKLGELYSKKQDATTKINLNVDREGYFWHRFVANGQRRLMRIHRMVAYTFLETPSPINEYLVHHQDENKLNNHIDNLIWMLRAEHARQHALNYWDTIPDNMRLRSEEYKQHRSEAVRRFLNSLTPEQKERRSLHHSETNSQLTIEQVYDIRIRHERGEKPLAILKDYPFIKVRSMRRICNYERWKYPTRDQVLQRMDTQINIGS